MSVHLRLRQAIDGQGLSVRQFQKRLQGRHVPRSSYPAVHRYYHGKLEPSVEFLAAAAEELGVLPAWLILGEGPRTAEEAGNELERAQGERLKGEAREDSRHIAKALKVLNVDQWHSGPIEGALLRFARKLRDAEHPASAWDGFRDELLGGAARFLVGVDAAFEQADHRFGDSGPGSRLSTAGLLLWNSSSNGWKVTWYDAVLDLFARRVIGLGERGAHWLDSHNPTIDDRRRTMETLWAVDEIGRPMSEATEPKHRKKRHERAVPAARPRSKK